MPFNDQEASLYRGAPVELYLFQSDDALERWRFTTGDEDIQEGADVWERAPIQRGALVSSTGEAQGPIEVKLPADHPVARKFVAYLPERPINLAIFRYHRTDLAAERLQIFSGRVSSVSFREGEAIFTCQPILNAMGRKVPWQSYKSLCNWALYGPGCGVLRLTHQLVLATGPNFGDAATLKDPQFLAQPDGWFTNGYIEVTETRETRFIINHTGDTLTLIAPLTNFTPGMEMRVYPGCDRTENTCRVKFNNIQNYLGFNRIPTENPFDTSLSGNGSGGLLGGNASGYIAFLRSAIK